MTCSFHKFGSFFPGTGGIHDIGKGQGERYSVNVPLKAGIKDPQFYELFKNITDAIRTQYQPQAVVV